MTSNDKGRKVSEIVGQRLRQLREAKDLRQEDVAEAAQSLGLQWARSSVAALEAGTRSLSVEEFLLVPALVNQLGGWDKPLLLGTDLLALSGSLTIAAMRLPDVGIGYLTPLRATNLILEESKNRRELEELGSLPSQDRFPNMTRHQVNQARASTAVYKRVVLALNPSADPGEWEKMVKRDYEITRNVASRLVSPRGWEGVKPLLVRAFTFALYGRPLGAERDARADQRGPYPSQRALRSARGHATRELIDELQGAIESRWNEVQPVFDEYDAAIDDPEALADWLVETAKMG